MNREDLFDAITDVKDELVEEAAFPQPAKRSFSVIRWASLAAAALAIVAGVLLFSRQFNWTSLAPGANAGGSGHPDGSTEFMSYAGPVFPLTALEGGEGLTVSRSLTYDFSPWIKTWWSNEEEAASRTDLTEEERQSVLEDYNEWYPEGGRYKSSTDLLVTDSYTLENPTEADRTVKVLYPFVSSLLELSQDAPTLLVDGAEQEPALRTGGYSGGFQKVTGSSDDSLRNLAQLNSWEGYRALLSDGTYLEKAQTEWPDLSETPVTVYKFTDPYGPAPDDKAGIPNPSIRAGFTLDYDKTTVLSYGFNGGRYDREGGTMTQVFSIPQSNYLEYGKPCYLIVIGEDIKNLTTGGYVTGGTDSDTEELPGTGVTVERYESDLESALRETAELMYGWGLEYRNDDACEPDFELYFGAMKDYLLSYGLLSEDGVGRYDTGWLESLDFDHVNRVFYLETEVTIPAGESVSLEARIVKEASYDFACAGTENRGICGYDTMTKLGSTLSFSSQTARAVNTDQVEIVRQNYGFDWENGIAEVNLDPDTEHYYLEVRRKGED